MAVSLPWIEVVLPAYVVARAARSFEPIMWDRHGSAAYSIYRLGAPWAGFAEPGPRSKRCGFSQRRGRRPPGLQALGLRAAAPTEVLAAGGEFAASGPEMTPQTARTISAGCNDNGLVLRRDQWDRRIELRAGMRQHVRPR